MFRTGVLYLENLNATEDTVVNQGGTSSGKTYSILQVLCSKAVSERNRVITVAGQDIPNLKKGALRDMEDIVENSPDLQQLITGYNKTDRVYAFKSGSIMEFNSYDGPQDAKSGKRHYLFVNEANGIPYNVYTELALRTKTQVFIDYNPNSEFWVHANVIPEPSTKLIISDHRHNPFCPQKIRDKIEALRFKDPELFKVYGRGKTGKIEGLILRNWHIVEGIPAGATFVGYGLDFGFTNDPTAVVGVWKQDGELWLNEIIYETDLTNPQICTKLLDAGITRNLNIIADSAEPKSIREISGGGFSVLPAEKGPDSVKNSIDILKRWKLNITRDSVNLRKELSTWKWRQTKDGTTLNEPVDFMNHAIDAVRYVALNKLTVKNSGKYAYR